MIVVEIFPHHQHLQCVGSHPPFGDIHCCQSGPNHIRNPGVVDRNNGKIVGDTQTLVLDGCDGGDSTFIVGGEDRRGTRLDLQNLEGQSIRSGEQIGRVGDENQILIVGDTVVDQRLAIAGHTPVFQRQKGDPFIAETDEMLDCLAGRCNSVENDSQPILNLLFGTDHVVNAFFDLVEDAFVLFFQVYHGGQDENQRRNFIFMDVLIEEYRIQQGIEEGKETNFLAQAVGFLEQAGKDDVVEGAFQDVVTLAAGEDTQSVIGVRGTHFLQLGVLVRPIT